MRLLSANLPWLWVPQKALGAVGVPCSLRTLKQRRAWWVPLKARTACMVWLTEHFRTTSVSTGVFVLLNCLSAGACIITKWPFSLVYRQNPCNWSVSCFSSGCWTWLWTRVSLLKDFSVGRRSVLLRYWWRSTTKLPTARWLLDRCVQEIVPKREEFHFIFEKWNGKFQR